MALLPTLRRRFFQKGAYADPLVRSVFVGEVTQVNSIPACWQAGQCPLSPAELAEARLHEVTVVKVPRPDSPFITHETPLSGGMAVAVSRGKYE
jgi:hypothetical protein